MTAELVLFVIVCCLGTLVQSVVGFGGAMFSVPLFVLFLDPRQAVPTYNLTLLPVELLLLVETWKHVAWRRVGKLLGGAAVGVPVGAWVLATLPSDLLRLIVSLLTLLFVVLYLLNVRLAVRENTATQLAVGCSSGLLGGAISISGPPLVIFGLARNWPKDAFRSTLVAYFFFLTLIALAWFGGFGLLNTQSLTMAGSALVPVLLVSHLGIRLKRRASEALYRKFVMGVILLVSLLGLLQVTLYGS